MKRAGHLLAVILPALGLVALWGWSDHLSRQGTEWEVEVQGYDPRDLLRGHYVEFNYDWPQAEGESDPIAEERAEEDIAGERWQPPPPPPQQLCIFGDAPTIERTLELDNREDMESCAHPAIAELGSVYGSNSLTRSRLYVGQDRAQEIEELMRDRDQRGIVRIRQRDDGTITPVEISFRPLTEAEIAERDQGDDNDGGPVVVQIPSRLEPAPD